MSINRAILLGNVGADPDIRTTQSGDKVATFRIATSEAWRDKATGERKETTEWHTVVVFSQTLCGIVEQYVKKGLLQLKSRPPPRVRSRPRRRCRCVRRMSRPGR